MKKGDMRRDELLETAERLFTTRGYEATAVQDIIDAMHYSKGGFYHHFTTKLEVLEAICERRVSAGCAMTAEAVRAAGASPVDRLNALLRCAALWTDGAEGFAALLIRVAYRRDSALMRERIKDCQLQGLRPMLTDILSDGRRSGDFFLSDPESCADVVLNLMMRFADEVAFLMAESKSFPGERLVPLLEAYRTSLERILSAPFGSVLLFDIAELQALWDRLASA